MTIFPFNFIISESLSWQSIIKQFHWTTNIENYVRNILLFLPLGIVLTGGLNTKKINNYQIIIITLFISAILSTNIELIQILLPSRFSSVSDIIYNIIGAALGSILYCWRGNIIHFIYVIIKGDTSQLNIKVLMIIIASYCLVINRAPRLIKFLVI